MSTRSHTVNTRANFQRADTVTWVGNSCGRHGSYIFYKAFRFRPFDPTQMTSSSGVVRSTRRERRNTLSDSDVIKPAGEKASDVADVPGSNPAFDEKILCLGEFFFVQCRPEDPVCVGELQLLWHDKHSGQDLSSTRLYYLPETTPSGRTSQHGQDEVLAVSEKVVMRTTDLASWIVEPEEWNYGCSLPTYKSSLLTRMKQPVSLPMHQYSRLRACVNMNDVVTEKQFLMIEDLCPEHQPYAKEKIAEKQDELPQDSNSKLDLQKIISTVVEENPSMVHCSECSSRHQKAQVMVLSLTSYCHHKAAMRRLGGSNPKWFSHPGADQLLATLGAITSSNSKLRIVFCRDTFDYSQLFEHDLICEEFAPVFKGRPRKKTKKGANHGIGRSKKTNLFEDFRNGNNVENSEGNLEKAENNRRRSKRKNPQRSSDDEGFAPTLSLARIKRSRRGHARTPTPVIASSCAKSTTSGSKSEPSSPTDKGAQDSGRRRSKRRPRNGRFSDLKIALQNSLLENHKITKNQESKKRLQQQTSSSASSASESSRSPSPTDGIDENSKGLSPSPDSNSSAPSTPSDSNDADHSPESLSPLDFSAAITPPDSAEVKKDLDLTSESNMYLRGLSEGHLPENKSDFLDLLYQFMRKRNTPIGRIPSLGFKKLDLWAFFKLSQEYGGYDMVTAKRLWKHVYDRMGGNPSCTSAATCTRKHFEKLLLPLELYLRQAVTKAKNEENAATTKTETPSSLPSLNGRTFDGDVYFPNCGKINNVATSIADQKAVKVEPSSTETFTSIAATVTSPTTSSPPALVTSSTPAPMPLLVNGLNLVSLVHKVVQSEIMDRAEYKPAKQEREVAPAVEKTNKTDGEIAGLNPVEVIDLTEGSSKAPTTTVKTENTVKPPVYSKAPILPRKPQFFTRTHCPRNSNAPPPFIPKPSTTKMEPTKPISVDTKRNTVTDFVDLSRTQKDNTPRDKDKLQKRPIPYNPSPPSPKKSRESLVPEALPSNRSYNVGSFVSTNHKFTPARPISDEFHQSKSYYDYQKFSSKGTGLNSLARLPTHSSSVYINRPLSPKHSDRRILSETSRISAKQAPISSETYRPLPNRSDTSILKYPTNHRHSTQDERSHKEKESYYRPASMLAAHRQQQAKANSLSNGAIKDNKHLVEDKDVHRLSGLIHSRPSAIPLPEPVKKDYVLSSMQTNRLPSMLSQPKKDQPLPKTSFSSSFSVDRLTSDPDKRPSLPLSSTAPRVVRSEESRGHFSGPLFSSSYTTVPRYVDPRQVPFKTMTEKETFRPSSSISVNESNRVDRARWNPSSQSYNGVKASVPSSIASSSMEKTAAAATCRVILDRLPPELAPLVRSQMPPDCSPAALQAIILKLLSSSVPSAAALPQALTGLPFAAQNPLLPEQLLRPEATLLLRNSPSNPAVINELSRAALLQNSISSAEQLAFMQMYNTAMANALLSTNPALLPQLSDPAALAATNSHARAALSTKLPSHTNLLGQLSRAPINFQQPPILVSNSQRPQQRGGEAVHGIPFPLTRR